VKHAVSWHLAAAAIEPILTSLLLLLPLPPPPLLLQWNYPDNANSQFVLQPYTVQGSTRRFNSTSQYNWLADS
jgi:hypothetical protein